MYRMRGHVLANLDPLGSGPGRSPELDLEYYGLTLWDLDREFFCDGLGGKKTAKLRDIIQLPGDLGWAAVPFQHYFHSSSYIYCWHPGDTLHLLNPEWY